MDTKNILGDGVAEMLTEAASALRSALRAPIVVVLAGSMDQMEPTLIGLAGRDGDPDEQLISILERCLKVARARLVARAKPDEGGSTMTVVLLGEDGLPVPSAKA